MKRVALLVALVACGDESAPAARKQAPPPPPPPLDAALDAPSLDRLSVTIDGQPVALTHAMIKRLPVGRFQILLRNRATPCRELLDNLFGSDDADVMILADTAVRVGPDGTTRTIVVNGSHDGPGDVDPGSTASVAGDAAPGTTHAVTLDFTGTGLRGNTLVVRGTADATGCGDDVPGGGGMPTAPHPSTATVTVAGRTLPIVGAISEDGGRRLTLSTAPKDCSGWIPWAELRLHRNDGFWKLDGEWPGEEHGNHQLPDPRTRKLKITAGARGTSPDGPTVSWTLSGSGRIGAYDVALAGTVEALDCPADD